MGGVGTPTGRLGRWPDDPSLPSLARVLFQGTRTPLKATRKNKEPHHKIRHCNSDWKTLYEVTAWTVLKRQCHHRERITHCFRSKATEEIREVKRKAWSGLGPGLGKKVPWRSSLVMDHTLPDFCTSITVVWPCKRRPLFLGNTYRKVGGKGHDVCNVLSSGSGNKTKHVWTHVYGGDYTANMAKC